LEFLAEISELPTCT